MKEYIAREAAIKELCQVSAPTPSESYIVEKCIDKLDNMSAADVVELKHGYWKDNHNGTFTCSECNGKSSKMDWCGRCGAKMDGEINK